MSYSNMEHYRDNLAHLVRPEAPKEREEADSIRLQDYEALYLHNGLVEYAAYGSEDAEEEEIALAYAEYINMAVRDEEKRIVNLYAHTEEARTVLVEGARAITKQIEGLQHGLVEQAEALQRNA